MIYQTPVIKENWLYNNRWDVTTVFSKRVYIPDGKPKWSECTNEQKEEWDEEFKPQPESPVETIEEEIL